MTATDTTLISQGSTGDRVCVITSSIEHHGMLTHPVASKKQAYTHDIVTMAKLRADAD